MSSNSEVAAQNIYADWKKAIRKASASIRVVTPYFDRTLIDLLKTPLVNGMSVQILTDADSPNWLEAFAQLKAMIRLIELGAEIRSFEGLHAKVLLTDSDIRTVGSQNFTRRGKLNAEVSALFHKNNYDAKLRIQDWWDSGREVFKDDLMRLLDILEPKIQHLKILAEELQEEYEEIQVRLESERECQRLAAIRNRVVSSAIFLENDVAYVEAKNSGLYVYDSQLTLWKDVQSRERKIKRLFFYPVYFFNSKRLAYCRVGKTRITYLNDSVNWEGSNIQIGDAYIHNYSVHFKHSYKGAEAHFDCNLGSIKILFNDGDLIFSVDDKNSELADVIEDPVSQGNVADRVFKSLKFKRMSHMSINQDVAEQYFEPDDFYNVEMIEVFENPVFVIYK